MPDHPSPAPLPRLRELTLPAEVRAVDFVSDLHLCADMPCTGLAFSHYLEQTRADAVFILGDLFEVWVGDDALACAQESAWVNRLAQRAQRSLVYLMCGNRDFLLGDLFFRRTGIVPLDDPCLLRVGSASMLLSHGDALCVDDTEYQAFRAQVRQLAWQQAFLARPLSERMLLAARMREASSERQRHQVPADYADVDAALAGRWLGAAGTDTLVHGHTHRPASQRHPQGWIRHVLSDWDCDQHPQRAEVLRWQCGGFSRLGLDQV